MLTSQQQKRNQSIATFGALIAAPFALLAPAHAASPISPASRTAPETLVPPHALPQSEITLPETQSAEAPPGSDKVNVHIGLVSVEGGSPAFASVIAAATDSIHDRDTNVAALYAAAAKIEAAYANAGYVLTRVTVPPQTIKDGATFRILIVEGFIESIDDKNVPAHIRRVVRARLGRLIGQHGLTLAQIERRVLLAGEVPGVQLRSTLMRGTALGGARLVLAADYRPVSLSLSADNGVGNEYQHISLAAQVSLNSTLGLGELIYLQATTSPDLGTLFSASPNRRILGAGVIVPLGSNGLTLNPEYTNVITTPRGGAGALAVRGHFDRFALRFAYPVIKTRLQRLELTAGVEAENESELALGFGQLVNQDKLRIINVGLDWDKTLSARSSLSTSISFAQGLAGLGARSQADATASNVPLSRLGSQPDFSKAMARLRLDYHLGGGFNLTSTVKGQATLSGPLPSAAQFSIDGNDGVSVFDLGVVSIDSGVTGRAELSRPVLIGHASKALITPYVFGAAGYGHLEQPSVLERANISSWAGGAGLRILLSPAKSQISSTGTIEVSHGHLSTLGQNPTRINASISFRF